MFKKIIITFISLTTVILLCIFNGKVINTKQLKNRCEIIETNKMNTNGSIMIAYFSDLHYPNYIDEQYLDKVVNQINIYKPDVVLFGGDLIENSLSGNDLDYLISSLKTIDAKYGKYAIYGEYDLESNYTKNKIQNIYEESNFRILNNQNISLDINNETINIIGLNSLEKDINEAFKNVDTNNYTFVLCHYPDDFIGLKNYNFDYCLSGHSHGNQIYVPIINLLNLSDGAKEYNRGKKTVDNKTLDITNGVGRTNNNARFLADAEIVLYRLEANTNLEYR